MSLNHENIVLFDRYISNKLDAQEKAEFDQKLAHDPVFKDQYEQFKQGIDTVKTYAIGAEMGEIIDSKQKKNQPNKIIAIAAAIILLITVPLFYYQYSSNTADSLFEQYYTAYPADPNLRGRSVYNEAMQLYSKGEYKEASTLFESLSNDSENRNHLFLGNCYLSMNQPKKAIEQFKGGLTSTSQVLTQNNEWYLVLAYLQAGNKAEAIKQLKLIASQKHIFKAKAEQLLDELE